MSNPLIPFPEPDMSHRKAPDDCEEETSYSAEAMEAYATACVAAADREWYGKLQAADAEIKRLQSLANDTHDELDEYREECARLRVDAERYRWLRDPNNMHAREIVRYYGDVDASELDAAIDAAMKADKEP